MLYLAFMRIHALMELLGLEAHSPTFQQTIARFEKNTATCVASFTRRLQSCGRTAKRPVRRRHSRSISLRVPAVNPLMGFAMNTWGGGGHGVLARNDAELSLALHFLDFEETTLEVSEKQTAIDDLRKDRR